MKFTEAQLEQAFIHLLQQEEMQHVLGNDLRKNNEFSTIFLWRKSNR